MCVVEAGVVICWMWWQWRLVSHCDLVVVLMVVAVVLMVVHGHQIPWSGKSSPAGRSQTTPELFTELLPDHGIW